MDDLYGMEHSVDYKTVYLPGSPFTFFVGYMSLIITVIIFIGTFLQFTQRGDFNGGGLEGFGRIWLIPLIISYLSFSYRIVISRNRDTIIIWRQFITSQFQLSRGEYAFDSLRIDEFTRSSSSEAGDSEFNYTTIYSGDQAVLTYAGTKKELEHLVPELLIQKSESVGMEEAAAQPFWSDLSKES